MNPEGKINRAMLLAWAFAGVTAGVVLSSCATSGDIAELGYTVDKRLALAEVEIARLHTDAADRDDVERRFAEAREDYERGVAAVGQDVNQRTQDLAGTVSKLVGLPEAIGIAIASMIATWLGRDWTRKKTIQRLSGEHHQ
jgi:hypothetical protein